MQHALTLSLPVSSSSFRSIYNEHSSFVWRSVSRRGVPAASVEDVVQDVFLAVYQNLQSFSGEAPLRHWIAGIVRNVVCLFFRRRENRTYTVAIDERTDAFPDNETPAERFDRKSSLELLGKLLTQMTDRQREAFWLYEVEEMPGSEVAEVLGVSENTVRMRVRAARRQLDTGVEEARTLKKAG